MLNWRRRSRTIAPAAWARSRRSTRKRLAPCLASRHRQRLGWKQFAQRVGDQRALFAGSLFQHAVRDDELRELHSVALLRRQFLTDEHVHHAELVFEQQEHDAARRERTLTAD